MKWKMNLIEMIKLSDTKGAVKEISLSWMKRNPLYYFFNKEDDRVAKLKWKQQYILISICLLVFGLMCLMISFLLYDFGSNGIANWWANALMSLGTGLFAGWTLYVLSNVRMCCEASIDQRLTDIDVLYNFGKKVYDINEFYITYNLLPLDMKRECDHNQEFSNAFIAAYNYVENMSKLGNRKVLETKFDFDYDRVKNELEKMSTEITSELTYKDVRKYLKEIIGLIENSYTIVEDYKKECEVEKTIIRKVPF